mmetsp:Transcript_25896/g.49086  ORF Transcript_25896/g.49086 Transcript_25896/m.49086 type:complete len:723 (-) Transcript_25896:77-2245(-)|eukprot:scaffold22229_cov155-Amphora_coffeaeformis.AAC.2
MTTTEPTKRDVVLGSDNRDYVMNDFLTDVVRLHRVIYAVEGKEKPTEEDQVKDITEHVYKLITKGKEHHLAGIRNVPTPFLTSEGRFLKCESSNEDGKEIVYTHKELSETEAKEHLTKFILEEFAKSLDIQDKESPYKEFADMLKRYPVEEESKEKEETKDTITPSAKDAILIAASDTRAVSDRIQEHELGNKVLFSTTSQVVSAYTISSEKRVEATLTVMHSIDDAHFGVKNPLTPEGAEAEATVPPPSQKARFLIRKVGDDERSTWSMMDGVSAAFLLLCFVFEVYLEKGVQANEVSSNYPETLAGSTGAIENPTDFDVLFGRGGLTNAHPGNKRFRDVIALHRPDYIRAIKMDKPAVARKIVRSIRLGTPPGRFLKKNDDGKWYDVGDRTAAEKTSQGLRERTNAEKRQRHALREALRIRKQDMTEGEEGEGDESKKTSSVASPAPVPILNYVGTNLAVPLSLGMKEPPRNTVKRRKTENGAVSDELNTEGLPPNAVDEDGNILVTDYDILCGRGGLTNHHKGNKRFRDIVALHRPDYVRAPKIQKPSVARVIVRAIRNGDPPGRFLRKDEKSGKWIDIGDKKAAEKTSQALREKTNEEREQIKKDPSSVASPSTIGLLPAATTTDFLATAGAMMAGIPAAQANVVVATGEGKSEEKKDGKDDAKPTAEGEEIKKDEEMEDKNIVKDPTANLPKEETEPDASTDVKTDDKMEDIITTEV